MKKRELGSTGVKLSIVGLGGGQFAESDHTVQEIREIIKTALSKGINYIDTAEDYGEQKIGEALQEVDKNYYISSKTFAKDKREAKEDIKNSLENLGQDQIDFYFIHNPMSVEDYKRRIDSGVLEALLEAREEGLVKYIGVSCDYTEPLELAIEEDIDVIMAHYNVGNTLSEEVIDKAHKKGIGVMAAKPFAGGILVDPETKLPGKQNDMTPEKALNFILSNKNVSTAIVGTRFPWQVEECAEAVDSFKSLKDKKVSEIKEYVSNFLGDNFCRDCRYCMPVETLGHDFDIPEVFRFLDRYEKYGYKLYGRVGFSKLDFKDKIDDLEELGEDELSCPFGIDIKKRLKTAKRELDLTVSENKWLQEMKELRDQVPKSEINTAKREIKSQNSDMIIDCIHSALIPEERLSRRFGVFLMEGIYSFGRDKVYEVLRVME